MLLHLRPVVRQLANNRLAAHHQAIRIVFAVVLIAGSRIIQAENIQLFRYIAAGNIAFFALAHVEHQRTEILRDHVEERRTRLFLFLLRLLGRKRLWLVGAAFFIHANAFLCVDVQQHIDARCHGAGIIQRVDKSGQLVSRFHALREGRFRHLVADGIQNHAGMAVILGNHSGQIILPVFGKNAGIVMVGLGCVPAVKGLIHDIHTKAVTGIQQGAACRVMGAAHGVITRLFHNADAAFLGIGKAAGAQNAIVVVDAPTAQLDRLAVDAQTGFCAPCQCADAERDGFLVVFGLDHAGVQVRVFGIPQLSLRDLDDPRRSFRHALRAIPNFHRRVFGFGLHLNYGGSNRHRADLYRAHAVFRLYHQMHRAVDAAARVPAAVGFQTVIHRDAQGVFPGTHFSGGIGGKFRIAVTVFGNFFAVQINDRILIHALKQKCQCLIQVLPRQRERLFIGIFPARKIAAVLAVLAVFLPGFLQHGIMGQMHGAAASIRLVKAPIGVKIQYHNNSLLRKTGCIDRMHPAVLF